jgi:excisionase family DNA binding protein
LDDWLSSSQAAGTLGISVSRIGQLRRERRLPALQTPLGYLYHREDLATYLEARYRVSA